jgi:hypothetical protein
VRCILGPPLPMAALLLWTRWSLAARDVRPWSELGCRAMLRVYE